MIQEQVEDIEHPIDTIRRTVREKLEASGYNEFYDEAAMLTITGESVTKTNSEKRLILDTMYLQKKVRILEDMVLELVIEKENVKYNKKFVQTTVFGERVKS